MPGPVSGGPKPPVSTDIHIQPVTTDEVTNDSAVVAPTRAEVKPPVDELVRSDHGVRSDAREMPHLDDPF